MGGFKYRMETNFEVRSTKIELLHCIRVEANSWANSLEFILRMEVGSIH